MVTERWGEGEGDCNMHTEFFKGIHLDFFEIGS